MQRPLTLSIVTPSYQQAAFLPDCLRSVAEQGYTPVEHIVMDGGSTDGSAEIIAAHAEHLAHWQSAKDKGQSDAINQGLARATGDVFNWLNSDDELVPDALDRVAAAFSADPQLLIYGGQLVFHGNGKERLGDRLNGTDEFQLFVEPVINQPATFLRMEALRTIGGVETRLRYVMDLELWWQLLFRFGTARLHFEPVPLARFRFHQDSKTVAESQGFLDETASLLHALCTTTGNHDLATVLAEGHTITTGLRHIPATSAHQAIVRAMAVHFLLKWNGTIHRREQFRMMRAFRQVPLAGVHVLPGMEARLPALDRQLAGGSWTLFRLRRKWQHLRA